MARLTAWPCPPLLAVVMIVLLAASHLRPAAGQGGGAGVIVPDSARWDAWVLGPHDRHVLAATAPLAAGGRWTALFGMVTDSGDGTVTYTAPADVPPYGLDEIDYGNSLTRPNVQLMVFVYQRINPPASLTPQWQQQPVAWAPLALLRRVPADFRGDYARTVRWIRRQHSAKGPSRRGGYVLPAWVEGNGAEVYTPAASPHGAKPVIPVVCKSPGPVNPFPPSPVGTPRRRGLAGGAGPVRRLEIRRAVCRDLPRP